VTAAGVDLGAYLGRIGLAGPVAPTVETLRAIHRLHPQASPFENLDPLRGAPVHLDAVNYYLSTSPASHFTQRLIAARTEPGRRHALRDAQLAIHHTGGPTERRTLGSARELREVLEATFGIAAPGDAALEAALERIATAPG
jgi:arylamine N-acetyltransferase